MFVSLSTHFFTSFKVRSVFPKTPMFSFPYQLKFSLPLKFDLYSLEYRALCFRLIYDVKVSFPIRSLFSHYLSNLDYPSTFRFQSFIFSFIMQCPYNLDLSITFRIVSFFFYFRLSVSISLFVLSCHYIPNWVVPFHFQS